MVKPILWQPICLYLLFLGTGGNKNGTPPLRAQPASQPEVTASRVTHAGRMSRPFMQNQETRLQQLADWIARYHDFAWDRHGDLINREAIHSRASRNHNPGKLRAFPGYRQDSQGYSIFPSAAVGWRALDAYLLKYARRHGRLSLRCFIDGDGKTWRGYRPADADDPQHSFVSFLALGMGLAEDTPMGQLIHANALNQDRDLKITASISGRKNLQPPVHDLSRSSQRR